MRATNWTDSSSACPEQGIIIVKYFEIWICIVPSLLLLCVIVISEISITVLQHIDIICLASGIRKHQTCLEIPSVTHITLKFSLIQHGHHSAFSVTSSISPAGEQMKTYLSRTQRCQYKPPQSQTGLTENLTCNIFNKCWLIVFVTGWLEVRHIVKERDKGNLAVFSNNGTFHLQSNLHQHLSDIN